MRETFAKLNCLIVMPQFRQTKKLLRILAANCSAGTIALFPAKKIARKAAPTCQT